jgi:hypothetical protein
MSKGVNWRIHLRLEAAFYIRDVIWIIVEASHRLVPENCLLFADRLGEPLALFVSLTAKVYPQPCRLVVVRFLYVEMYIHQGVGMLTIGHRGLLLRMLVRIVNIFCKLFFRELRSVINYLEACVPRPLYTRSKAWFPLITSDVTGTLLSIA